ncbi:MAG TPA: glycosyltransferase family 39 protein [Solirubrobacteraceae bacterium]|nr:glycosyltransferase family 39 protein [Solirubrobacteraceae bacterium]
MSAVAQPAPAGVAPSASRLPRWWPLAALTVAAAALRLSTLGLQSFWYDEAFTPVHVLHPSLWATLRSVVHSENTPPLWYLLAWVDSRILGTGEVALRLPSALAGIATVGVAWAIGRELAGRRAALACAALVAFNPLLVWYSQEARAYALFVLMAALAMLCFLRAEREPSPRRMAAFALTGALALLSHYFAVFLLIPMALWLLSRTRTRRAALPASGAIAIVGAALMPLIVAQGGHGTQWIGRWPLIERLEAIPQYYLTGYSGAPLGHGVELLVALPILAALGLGLWRMSEPSGPSLRGVLVALSIAACGVLTPIVLVAFGADYLAPRNLVAAMIPVSAVIAVMAVWPRTGPAGVALVATIALAFAAISIDVDLSPRLQRGDWRGLAQALGGGSSERAITTVELGSAPLEYYVHGLRGMHAGTSVTVNEIDETGYAPLRPFASQPPAPGFHLIERRDVNGLVVYRFVSRTSRSVSEATLRRHVITLAQPEVLVGAHASLATATARAAVALAHLSSLRKKI